MSATATPRPPRPGGSRRARGEGILWMCGGALSLCLLLILGLLSLVIGQGAATFWPLPLLEVRTADGRTLLGEPTRTESFTPPARDGRGETTARTLLRTGNFEQTGTHFHWVAAPDVIRQQEPLWALVVERLTWGRAYGTPIAWRHDGRLLAEQAPQILELFERHHATVRAAHAAIEHLRSHDLGRIAARTEAARLAVRRAVLDHGADSPQQRAAETALIATTAAGEAAAARIQARIAELQAGSGGHQLVLRTAQGGELVLAVGEIVRAYPANALSTIERLGVYLSRWWEFLTADPRESNSEGGVWPAIVGTVLMTLLMSLCVVPFGVLAALYLREYAKAGVVISAVRIAINNLAGVPSIVFGVFGLGFFCYLIGGSIDSLFYPENLPNPTFGKGALLWASLTLALLTLPVVIVATEEALAAVPGSMREGSYACGASKWQTIRRIVLPRALPGVTTGAILAMARGAGEVAPLMLVGAVKLAPELPLDGTAPYLHPARSFMHLGFHIYDLGFQSQNSEAAKPMVYTTTLLLIAIVLCLNAVAVALRTRLRARFAGAQF